MSIVRSRHIPKTNSAVATKPTPPKGSALYGSTSEFEIQAYLYHELDEMGYDVRGDVGIKTRTGIRGRMDLVTFRRSSKAVFAIEVKVALSDPESISAAKLQAAKYEAMTGIPVELIMGMEQAESYIDELRIDIEGASE